MTVFERFRPSALRATWWGFKAGHVVKRNLRDDGIETDVPPSPVLPDRERPAVARGLHLAGATCLVRSIVLQAWDADHGRPRDLIVGVGRQDGSVTAHAWLDGEEPQHDVVFAELTRRGPRVPR